MLPSGGSEKQVANKTRLNGNQPSNFFQNGGQYLSNCRMFYDMFKCLSALFRGWSFNGFPKGGGIKFNIIVMTCLDFSNINLKLADLCKCGSSSSSSSGSSSGAPTSPDGGAPGAGAPPTGPVGTPLLRPLLLPQYIFPCMKIYLVPKRLIICFEK